MIQARGTVFRGLGEGQIFVVLVASNDFRVCATEHRNLLKVMKRKEAVVEWLKAVFVVVPAAEIFARFAAAGRIAMKWHLW